MTLSAVVDPITEPVASIEDRLREVCGQFNVFHAQLVALAAEALETGSWHGCGVKSLTHWLTWQAGISPRHADDVSGWREARTTHPQVMDAFAEGAVSVDQAAVATKAPAYLDRQFAEFAQVMTVAQLRVAVRAARPAPPAPPPVDERSESFGGWFDDDGRYHLDGELDADHGREFEAALREARDAVFQSGQSKVTWADAMVEMARRSMDAAPLARRERFRVNWFVDPADPVPARWADGLAVPHWLVEMLSCDGTVSPVFTENARPVSVGRTQYAVPERTRRLVLYRDKKCRVPWCNQTRWLQVHHIIHDQHQRSDRHVEPRRVVPGVSPAPPQGSAGDLRQRRRPRRTHLHRRPRQGHRPRRPPHQAHRPTTITEAAVRASVGGTPPTPGTPLPRPTHAATTRAKQLTRAVARQGDAVRSSPMEQEGVATDVRGADTLTARNDTIVELYLEGATLTEIASACGLSVERVRQIVRRAEGRAVKGHRRRRSTADGERVRLRIGNLAKAVLVTGQAYQDPKDALNEFVSNAADDYAEAGLVGARIRVMLRRKGVRNVIAVDDGGRGMSPDRLRTIARNLFESAKAGDDRTLGEKAIGLLAFQQLGGRCDVVSREIGSDETWTLRLRRGEASADLARETRRARTTSGTTVYITELDSEAARVLTQRKVVDYLRRRRSAAIARGDYTIEVVEGRTAELVTPEEPSGVPVPIAAHATLWGNLEFALYAAPDSLPGRRIAVVGRAGTTIIDDLCELEEFDHDPWNSGQVSGRICFEPLRQTAGRRAVLRDDEIYPVFRDAVQASEPLVARAVERVRKEVDDATTARLSDTLRQIFDRVLKELADLENPMRTLVGDESGDGDGITSQPELPADGGSGEPTAPSIDELEPHPPRPFEAPERSPGAGAGGRHRHLPSIAPDPNPGRARSRFDADVYGIEHHHDGGAHQHSVGDSDRVGIGLRQLLHQPHHVVTEISEDSGSHGRQHVGQFDPAFSDERAQCCKGRFVARREAVGLVAHPAVDLGTSRHGAPDEIGVETDDGIASAHCAALHQFQQEAHGARAGDLEKRRHRGFEIRDQRGPDDLRLAAGVSLGKRRCLRLDLHGERQFALSPAPPLTTWFSAL